MTSLTDRVAEALWDTVPGTDTKWERWLAYDADIDSKYHRLAEGIVHIKRKEARAAIDAVFAFLAEQAGTLFVSEYEECQAVDYEWDAERLTDWLQRMKETTT